MHRLACDRCSVTQRAELPDGGHHGNFGDPLTYGVGYLSGRFDLFDEGFGIPLSPRVCLHGGASHSTRTGLA